MTSLSPEQIEALAEAVSEKSLANFLKLFGTDPNNLDHISALQADFGYLRKARQGSEDAMLIAKRTALGVFITSILALLLAGFKQWIFGG